MCIHSPVNKVRVCSPPGTALYRVFKLGLALKNRTPHVCWTVDSLGDRLMEADVTFPYGAAPAKAKLVSLIAHSLRASLERITEMTAGARTDKAARGGGLLIMHYVITVPAGWDELAKAVMRRAAEQAGLAMPLLNPNITSYGSTMSLRRHPGRTHVICTRARVCRPLCARIPAPC